MTTCTASFGLLNKRTVFASVIYGFLISLGTLTTFYIGTLNRESSDKEQFVATTPRNLEGSSGLVPKEETLLTKTTLHTDKICVIHAGPHKTGSTALQKFLLKDHVNVLTKDNYKSPSFDRLIVNSIEKNHANLAFCMRNQCPTETAKRDMIDYFHSFVDDASSHGAHIILTSEEFDHRMLNMTELTSILVPQQYKIHVVVYYRRFYDWIHSWHNQVSKGSSEKKSSLHATFVDWVTDKNIQKFQSSYSVAVYDRFKDFSGVFNISVVNMHEDPDNFSTITRFACGHMDEAPYLCDLAKSRPARNSNPSHSLDWKLFRNSISVYHSIELSDSDEGKWEKIEVKFYEMTDIPKRCLSPEWQNKLLQISLDAEIALTPESWHNGEEGLENLKSDFEEKINSKLCSIDIEKILTSSEWQDFLTELEEDKVEQGL